MFLLLMKYTEVSHNGTLMIVTHAHFALRSHPVTLFLFVEIVFPSDCKYVISSAKRKKNVMTGLPSIFENMELQGMYIINYKRTY